MGPNAVPANSPGIQKIAMTFPFCRTAKIEITNEWRRDQPGLNHRRMMKSMGPLLKESKA